MQPLDTGDPSEIGPYRLLGRLGAGGMGRVYLGRSVGGRTVAVKAVHPHFATDDEFRARFRREVKAARLFGTGAGGPRWSAPVLDADPEAPVPWVVTGYVAGPSLTQAVVGHGALPESSVRALGAGLAEALTAVHALDLVHRDVKPSNVLLALDGPRLIDFGIARATDGTSSLTSTGVSVGSPGYMSPEQILGRKITGAADVFSLGAVLAFASTGTSPFPGDSSASLLYKVVHEEPELDDLRGDVRDLVVRCLDKDPAGRPTPAEVGQLLAPEGAESLVAGGWLPGPLVEEVSRSVVRLLDLETSVHGPDAPAHSAAASAGQPSASLPTGPVAFSNPSLGGPSATEPAGASSAGPSLGTFGPPVEPTALDGAPSLPATAGVRTQTAPVRGDGPGADAPHAPAADAAPGRPRRRTARRLGCALAVFVVLGLGVTSVFAVSGFGSLILEQVRDDILNEGTTEPLPSDGGATAGTSGGSSEGSEGGPATGVPKSFVGTWSGPVTERSGLPHGTLTAEIVQGAKGEDIVRTTSRITVLGAKVECFGVGKLISATDDELRVEERTDTTKRSAEDLCTTGSVAELTFTRASGTTLDYASAEEAAGTPEGTLTKE
ncbi:serine/threonine-protein kinase [Streptomyces sp. NPDC127033]|uniref:serine/threonine-protein kinase n=1 Tax=Streptomyces sp. NPDC127033 TaxID=3347110 RepID=UPI00364DEB69